MESEEIKANLKEMCEIRTEEAKKRWAALFKINPNAEDLFQVGYLQGGKDFCVSSCQTVKLLRNKSEA